MRIQPAGGMWVAACPDCKWRTYSATRAVVQRRADEHECGRAR